MNSINEILNGALSLNEKDRALIAEKIILSLDNTFDQKSDEYWLSEISDRIKEIDNNKVTLIEWTEAKKQLE